MSGSDQSPEDVMEEVFGAKAELRATEAAGIKLLTGEAQVQLVVTAQGVATPQEAVDVVIRDLFRRGLDAFTFVVTDQETGEHFLVQDGEVVSTRQAREQLGGGDDSRGPKGESSSPSEARDTDLSRRIVAASADADIAEHEAAAMEAEARKARRRADRLRKHCDDLLLELQGQLTIDGELNASD